VIRPPGSDHPLDGLLILEVLVEDLTRQGRQFRVTGEAQRHELEAKAHEELAAAQARAAKFENFKLEIKAKAGAEGKLFGSIGTADIAEAAVKAGQPISRSEVRMPTGPIRSTGEHQVQLHLHTDIDVTLTVTVVAEE